ncbi:MAG: HAS-barrel domain-containing protein [Cyanobacteria bacterium P01_A01_bin.135]
MRLPLPLFDHSARDPRHIAEVIETATTEFLAQCLQPQDLSYATMPPFGSWVKAVDEASGNWVYGVVYHATTSSVDQVHRTQALGLSLDELRDQQPQIFAMLKTDFRAAIVGFYRGSDGPRPALEGQRPGYYQYLPPRPPQVHQPVYACTPEEVVAFTEALDFLRPLLQLAGAPADSLVAATIREVYQLRQGHRPWLVQAGRTLSLLLKDDYDRLRIILGQIHL